MLSKEEAARITDAIWSKSISTREIEERYHPADVAQAIDMIDDDEAMLSVFHRLGVSTASEVLPLLSDRAMELVLGKTQPGLLADIIGEMDSDDAADILGAMDENAAENILSAAPDEVDREVSLLMEFDEDSAGGIMQTELVSVPENYTIKQAIEVIRQNADETGDIHNIFVVDAEERFKGSLPLHILILKPEQTLVGDLVSGQPLIYAKLDDDQEKVAELFKRYDIVSLPVVDSQMRLMGRIMTDDVMDVMEEEANEDMMKMAGADDEALVQTHDALAMARYRLPWLGVTLIGEMVTGSLILFFKASLADALALTAFIPVVMGTGGNVGTQSSALVVRGLATGKIGFSSLVPYIVKEIKTGILLGLACGLVAGVVAKVWIGSVALGFVVGLSIGLAIAMAALLGVTIPLFFRWIKIDPAIAGGPIVLALNDISGMLIFLSVATALMNHLK